jgi:serine protease SohB
LEYLIQYGMFLAQVVTIVVAIVFVLIVIISASSRQRREASKGHIKVSKLNEHFEELQNELQRIVLDKISLKLEYKKKKQQAKKEQKEQKAQAKLAQDGVPERKKRVYVLNFKGDMAAHAVSSLREEISAVLSLAEVRDEVVLRLESPGGMVHAYGLASSQLSRIKEKKIPLTICVDKVAASGGYMMACLADRLVSAPFAIIGSIGVIVQLPNFHRVLKKNDIDFEMITAGEYKTTLTSFGEITQKGRDKVKEDVEDMHGLFKKWVKDHRPSVDIDKISTGETWVGTKAKARYMVDEIKTSDEVLMSACESADVFEVEFVQKPSLQRKLGAIFKGVLGNTLDELDERSKLNRYFS